jgi:nucleotide-binding universal stress UspA family protein
MLETSYPSGVSMCRPRAGWSDGCRRLLLAALCSGGQALPVSLLEVVQEAPSVNEREARLAQQLGEQGSALANDPVAEASAVKVSDPIDESIIAHADAIDAPLRVLSAAAPASARCSGMSHATPAKGRHSGRLLQACTASCEPLCTISVRLAQSVAQTAVIRHG